MSSPHSSAQMAMSFSSLFASFFVSLFLSSCLAAGGLPQTGGSPSTDFIRASCRDTQYPDLCFHCLAAYAPAVRRSPRQLALVALDVSADHARAASAAVARLMDEEKSVRSRDAGAVRDCMENIADSVDRLKKSAQELDRIGRAGAAEFTWHMSNVQTWCSAALTDENTCLDSLSEYGSAKVRAAVRQKVVEVGQVTSNALALINRLKSKE